MKKPTWLHFTALIIKSYMHWEVQNILIPLCHILKRIFYILLWFESQREKNHYITGILFTSPTFLSFYKTFLGMVISLGNDLFTTNYYSYTCRSMNEDHLFSSLAFYFVKPFQYMEKWRPWCFQGFAKRVDLNEFKLIDADCCMLSQINSYLATTYFMGKTQFIDKTIYKDRKVNIVKSCLPHQYTKMIPAVIKELIDIDYHIQNINLNLFSSSIIHKIGYHFS